MPAEAVIIARRIPIPLFGAGLVEAIPDETILALEDPDDRDGDGISGRAAIVRDLATGDRASAASAGRLSTPRCWRSAPMRIATRWASPTICFADELGVGIDAGADSAGAIRFPIRKTASIRDTAAAASTTSSRS